MAKAYAPDGTQGNISPSISSVLTPATTHATPPTYTGLLFSGRHLDPKELEKIMNETNKIDVDKMSRAGAIRSAPIPITRDPVMEQGSAAGASNLKTLSEAYKSLGLATNSTLKDETIVDIYLAQVTEAPSQRESLIGSLKTIAEHKQSQYLKGFLAMCTANTATKKSTYKTHIDFLESSVRSVEDTLNHVVEDQISRVLQKRSAIAQPPKVEWVARQGDSIQKPEELMKTEDASSDDEDDAIVVSDVHHVTVVDTAAVEPSQPATRGIHTDTGLIDALTIDFSPAKEGAKAEDESTDWDQVGSAWPGTIDNPASTHGSYSNTPIRVLVGDQVVGYSEFHIDSCKLHHLFGHPKFYSVRAAMTPTKPIVIKGLSPYFFTHLLNMMTCMQYLGPHNVQAACIDYWTLSNVYGVANHFHLDGVKDVLRQIFSKAPCFGQLLAGVKGVYVAGSADEAFRLFFKYQAKLWLEDAEAAWKEDCCSGRWNCWAGLGVKACLKSAVHAPDFASDLLDILAVRESARGFESVSKGGRIDDDSNGVKGGGTTAATELNDEHDTNSYVRERQPKAEVNDIYATIGLDNDFSNGKTLFIASLPPNITGRDLYNIYRQHGQVTKIVIMHGDPNNNHWTTRAAYIEFDTAEEASKAYAQGSVWQPDGSILYIGLPFGGDFLSVYGFEACSTMVVHENGSEVCPPRLVSFIPPQEPTTSEAEVSERLTAVAVRDSNLALDCTLQFRKGEKLIDVTAMPKPPQELKAIFSRRGETLKANFYRGENCRGDYGAFPASYVRFVVGEGNTDV